MNRIENASQILFVMIVMTFVISCSLVGPERKIGKLVGYEASFGLDDALKGEIKDMDFGGVLILELDDGTEVKAAVDKKLIPTLRVAIC